MSDLSLEECLSEDAINLFHEYELEEMLDFNIAMSDPNNDNPIFFIEDMPYVIKRIVNAIDRSSNDRKSRNLKYGGKCINLRMIEQLWLDVGGATNKLNDHNLTGAHFDKDNWAKMRVYLAVQVLSASVVRMMNNACDDEDTETQFQKWYYEPLIELETHVNNLVDIINGHDDSKVQCGNFTYEKGVILLNHY